MSLFFFFTFFGFLQLSEVAKLRCCDIIQNNTFLSEKSKKDIYCQIGWIHFTNLDYVLYLIELISRYFLKKDSIDDFQKYIFRDIPTTKFHSILKTCDKRIGYICVRENILGKIKKIGADIKLFNLHNL